jgi:tripartite ATP-independent transporter DctM subunit
MSGSPTAIAMLGLMLVLMALRIPVAAAMFIPGVLGFAWIAGPESLLSALKGTTMARLSVYELSIIPLFLLMGQLAVKGGLSKALFDAAAAFVGHLKGGLGFAAILACAVFGSVCGSSVATTATITQVAYPEMKRHGYSGRLATATLATGGTLGILIPPSVPLVIYAILAEQNIAKLFVASIVPALIAIAGYLLVLAVVQRGGNPSRPPAKATGQQKCNALIQVMPILIIFLVVFCGIYLGAFTPTEGAAIGAIGMLIAGLARKSLTLQNLLGAVLSTAETTAMIFFIFLGADVMNSGLALTQLPATLATWVAGMNVSGLWVLVAILAFYLVLSAVMDELSMIMLTIPVLFPALMGLDLWGLDAQDKAIWFGILVLMVVQFGLIAPPIGLNVIIVNSLARDVPITDTYRGVLPFLASDFVRIILLLLFPSLSLWLVGWLD